MKLSLRGLAGVFICLLATNCSSPSDSITNQPPPITPLGESPMSSNFMTNYVAHGSSIFNTVKSDYNADIQGFYGPDATLADRLAAANLGLPSTGSPSLNSRSLGSDLSFGKSLISGIANGVAFIKDADGVVKALTSDSYKADGSIDYAKLGVKALGASIQFATTWAPDITNTITSAFSSGSSISDTMGGLLTTFTPAAALQLGGMVMNLVGMSVMNAKLDQMNAKLDEMMGKLDAIGAKLDGIVNTLADLKVQLTILQCKVDYTIQSDLANARISLAQGFQGVKNQPTLDSKQTTAQTLSGQYLVLLTQYYERYRMAYDTLIQVDTLTRKDNTTFANPANIKFGAKTELNRYERLESITGSGTPSYMGPYPNLQFSYYPSSNATPLTIADLNLKVPGNRSLPFSYYDLQLFAQFILQKFQLNNILFKGDVLETANRIDANQFLNDFFIDTDPANPKIMSYNGNTSPYKLKSYVLNKLKELTTELNALDQAAHAGLDPLVTILNGIKDWDGSKGFTLNRTPTPFTVNYKGTTLELNKLTTPWNFDAAANVTTGSLGSTLGVPVGSAMYNMRITSGYRGLDTGVWVTYPAELNASSPISIPKVTVSAAFSQSLPATISLFKINSDGTVDTTKVEPNSSVLTVNLKTQAGVDDYVQQIKGIYRNKSKDFLEFASLVMALETTLNFYAKDSKTFLD